MFDVFVDRQNIIYTDQWISDNMQFFAVTGGALKIPRNFKERY